MYRHFFVFAFLITQVLNAQKIKFVSRDAGAQIKVLTINSYNNVVDTFVVGKDSGIYKCNTSEFLVTIEKKGFKRTTRVIQEKEVKANKKRIVFEPLIPIPKKIAENRYVEVEEVSFNIKPGKYIKKYYENYTGFLNNVVEHSSPNDKEVKIESTIFDKSLNRFLFKNEFIDTTNKLSFTDINRVRVNLDVTAVTEHKIGPYAFILVEAKAKILNPVGGSLSSEADFLGKSFISFNYSSDDDDNYKSMFANALENVCVEMMNDSKLKENFSNIENKIKEIIDKWPLITIANKSKSESSLENAVNAVVTVKQKDGHGSGCIISSDGYIVTNYHVIGTDTSNTTIIFNNGAKKKCKVIRSNIFYDLSLLKVDTTLNVALKISTNKTFNIGVDVYAIGTPKDIDLGQSVTKGIISGKRKVENKIYIQSDVSVNGGNSGGALINKEGDLIGIVNAKLFGVGVEGVGFAIPAYYLEEALKIKIVQ